MSNADDGDSSHGQRSGVRIAEVAAVVAVLSILFAEAFYLLVLHDGPSYPIQARATAPSLQPTGDEPDPETPTPDAERPSEVGETRFGVNADTTLLQVRHIRPSSAHAPPPGQEWFGIRARTCLHPEARPSGGLPWSSWGVVDGAGTRYLGSPASWDDYPPQQLPTSGLQPGECNLGWVLIALPKGTSERIETVVFRPRSSAPAEWAA